MIWIVLASAYSLPAHIWRSVPLEKVEEAKEAFPGVYAFYKTVTGLLPR